MAKGCSTRYRQLPEGLLEALTLDPPLEFARHRVAVAREHADRRAYDDRVVVEAIASELLLLSHA
jgi:hypothetical protein